MVRPVPGYLTATSRARLAEADDRMSFAHADVSGLSLFEEAQYRGVVAADRSLHVVGSSGRGRGVRAAEPSAGHL